MKQYLKNILLLGAMLFILAFIMDFAFTKTFKKGKTVKVQWLQNISNNNYDYAIIGSSRAWWNVDVKKINHIKNINGINLSNNHFGLSEILLRLKRFYHQKNSIEKLLLQIDYKSVFSHKGEFSSTVYNYLPFIDDTLTYNHLKKRNTEWTLYKSIPFWRYAEYNFQWGLEEYIITNLNLRKSIFDNEGSYFTNNQFHGDSIIKVKYMKQNLNPDLIDIINFCNSKQIELQCFTAPYFNLIINSKTETKFKNIIDSLNLNHYNYTNSFKTNKSMFNDNTHLSLKGGAIFTDSLIVNHF